MFVHADLAPYPPGYHAERDQGAADHVKVLRQPPQGYVHILVALGKDIHRRFVVAVVFVEVNCLLGEGLIIPVIVLYPRFVYDDFGVLYHEVSDILFGVQLVGPGNGDV